MARHFPGPDAMPQSEALKCPRLKGGYRYATLAIFVCLALSCALSVEATARLATSSETTDHYDGSSHNIYIGPNDRGPLYAYPQDNLAGLTLEFKNNNGHSCNGVTATFSVKDTSDVSHNNGGTSDPFNTTSGQVHEVYIPWTGDEIALSAIKQITTTNPDCWGHLSIVYNAADVWGADAGTYYGTQPGDPFIKVWGEMGDPRIYPPTQVKPADGVFYTPTAVPFYFTTETAGGQYPDADPVFTSVVEAWNGEDAFEAYETYVYYWAAYPPCYTGALPGGNYAAGCNSALINDDFPANLYRIKTKVQFDGQAATDYSTWNEFNTSTAPNWGFNFGEGGGGAWSPDNPPPEFSCSVSNIAGCIGSVVHWLFAPSAFPTFVFQAAQGELNNRFPISWFSEFFGGIANAFNATPEDLGSPEAGNVLTGDFPNAAWWADAISNYWGDWAAPLAKAVIWLVVALAIGRSGLVLLNIPVYDDDDDA